MKPNDVVAIMLAFAIIMLFAAAIYKMVVYGPPGGSEIPKLWSDLVTFIVGGLTGYMTARK